MNNEPTVTAYTADVTYNGINFRLQLEKGFRGINIPCKAWLDVNGWKVTVNGENIPVIGWKILD